MKSGLLTDGIGGKSSTGLCTANRCFFVCLGNRSGPHFRIFPREAIGIAVVMDTHSGNGGSEDDRGREHGFNSVMGSPNGSECVSVSTSQVS